MTYPGGSVYFLPDRFRPLGGFRLFSTQALSTAPPPKSDPGEVFLPHLIARKGVDCTDGGNGSHVDAWPKYPPSYALWLKGVRDFPRIFPSRKSVKGLSFAMSSPIRGVHFQQADCRSA